MGCEAARILIYMNHQNGKSIVAIKVGVPLYQASYEITRQQSLNRSRSDYSTKRDRKSCCTLITVHKHAVSRYRYTLCTESPKLFEVCKEIDIPSTHQETSVFLAGWCKSFPGKPTEVLGVKKTVREGEEGTDVRKGLKGLKGSWILQRPDVVGGGANCPRYGEDLATAVDLELHDSMT